MGLRLRRYQGQSSSQDLQGLWGLQARAKRWMVVLVTNKGMSKKANILRIMRAFAYLQLSEKEVANIERVKARINL